MATRDELVTCGVRLLERDGLAAISLRRIAAEAGVSHGAPRHHFPTYGSLLAAIARRGVEDLDAVLTPALAGRAASHEGRGVFTGCDDDGDRDANGGGSDVAPAADIVAAVNVRPASGAAVVPAAGSPSPPAARAAIMAAARAYVGFARQRPEMFELIHRHDLLDDRGGDLRELTAPWFAALAARVDEVTGDSDPHLAAALWSGVHGTAVLTSRRTTEPVATLDPDVTLALLLDALLG